MKHTDEDIEKVARAIAAVYGDGDPYADEFWADYKPEAIAAIDAMLKPEPEKTREFWLWMDGGFRLNSVFPSHITKDDVHFLAGDEIIHVREVME